MKLTRTVYRAHNPRWAWAPDSGNGAAAVGGRCNPVGMPALYTSFRFQTAWLEAQQAFMFKPQPLTLCAYEVDCEDVLDLTDRATLAACEVVRSESGGTLGGHGSARCYPTHLEAGHALIRIRGCGYHCAELCRWGDRGRHQRGVLGLGAAPAAPGPCDR